MTITFSAIVVTLNEARHLEACLGGLRFCDEILVFDLGSTDGGPDLARRLGATVRHHPRVPVVELLRAQVAGLARHDWLVFVDPDEVYPAGIEHALRATIEREPAACSIGIPMDYYFRGRKLACTQWSGLTKWPVCHRARADLPHVVHANPTPRLGYRPVHLVQDGGGAAGARLAIEHRWMESWPQLFEKHLRYLGREGEAHHRAGRRFGWAAAGLGTAGALKRNLVDHGGLRGGSTGWLLSLFAAWYTAMTWVSLRRYETDHAP